METTVCVALVIASMILAYWLWRVPTQGPFKGIPFVPALHVPVLGAALQLDEVIEGTRKLCVEHADANGMASFNLVGTPVVTVLKAEHVRQVPHACQRVESRLGPCQVMLASNYRSPLPQFIHKHFEAFLGKIITNPDPNPRDDAFGGAPRDDGRMPSPLPLPLTPTTVRGVLGQKGPRAAYE